MNFKIKQIFILLLLSIFGFSLITCSSAYTGTGFSHDIPYSKYSDMPNKDILHKYNNTNCKKEFDKTYLYFDCL